MMELNQIFGKTFKQDKEKYQELFDTVNEDFYPLIVSQNSDDTTSFLCGLNLKKRLKKSILFSELLDFDFFCEENARFFIRSASLQLLSENKKSHNLRLGILPISLDLGVALFEGKIENSILRTFTDYTVEFNLYLKDHAIKFIEEFLKEDVFFDREKSVKYWDFLFPEDEFSQIELFNYFNNKLRLIKDNKSNPLFNIYKQYGGFNHRAIDDVVLLQTTEQREEGLPTVSVEDIKGKFINDDQFFASSIILDKVIIDIEEFNDRINYDNFLEKILLSSREQPNIESLLVAENGIFFTKTKAEQESGFFELTRVLTTGVTLEDSLSYYIPASLRSDTSVDESTRRQEQLSDDKTTKKERIPNDALKFSGLMASVGEGINKKLLRNNEPFLLKRVSFDILRKENVFSIRILKAIEKSNNFMWEMLTNDETGRLNSGFYLCRVVQEKRMIDKMPAIDRYFLLEV